MKKTYQIALMALVFLSGCATNNKNDTTATDANKDTFSFPKKEKKYQHLEFASKKDTICGMPISAGIEDTLEWKGKLYGFCAPECKEAFVAMLKKENKK